MKKHYLLLLLLVNTIGFSQCVTNISIGHPTVYHKSDGTLWMYKILVEQNPVILQIGSDTDWSENYSSYYNTLAIKNDGTLWMWCNYDAISCSNNFFNLGNTPTQVGTDTDWNKVSMGFAQCFAIKNNGTLWAWGNNPIGLFGTGVTTSSPQLVPTQVGTDTNWASVEASTSGQIGGAAALKTDGTIWCWGYASQVGTNPVISTPVQIGNNNHWSKIFHRTSSNGGFLYVLKNDNTLWQINPNTGAAFPFQNITDSDWQEVSMYYPNTLAIKENGTLWSWGENNFGQLGYGTLTYNYSQIPAQIGTATDWVKVYAVSGAAAYAQKQDGSIYSWGQHSPYWIYIPNSGQQATNTFSPGLLFPACTLGTESFENETKAVAYPNPTDNLISIDYTINEDSNVLFELNTIIGQKIISYTKPITTGENSELLDLAAYPVGVYLLTMTANGKISKIKIIKK